jgi:hypothetical protein
MKNRHAAALALVGWYLIVPPVRGTAKSDEQTAMTARLSYWPVLEKYDSVGNCQARAKYLRTYDPAKSDELMVFKNATEAGRWAVARSHATCVASNDPRLKQK